MFTAFHSDPPINAANKERSRKHCIYYASLPRVRNQVPSHPRAPLIPGYFDVFCQYSVANPVLTLTNTAISSCYGVIAPYRNFL
jgi:hypothetical protein